MPNKSPIILQSPHSYSNPNIIQSVVVFKYEQVWVSTKLVAISLAKYVYIGKMEVSSEVNYQVVYYEDICSVSIYSILMVLIIVMILLIKLYVVMNWLIKMCWEGVLVDLEKENILDLLWLLNMMLEAARKNIKSLNMYHNQHLRKCIRGWKLIGLVL